MIDIKKRRAVIVIVLAVLLLLYSGYLIYKDQYRCMNIPVVSEEFFSNLYEDPGLYISELLFNGIKIGSGEDLSTVYISQPVDTLQHYSKLYGTLTSSNPRLSLYFLKNSAIENVEDAVLAGLPISLIITDGTAFRKVDIIITTLPVVYIEQTIPDVLTDEQGRDVWSGTVTLIGKTAFSSDNYQIHSENLQWHIRGASSRYLSKKPYKLSLKDAKGNNSSADFLGLGKDDDWILNPMNSDDTKVREKFAMDFWNEFISDEMSNRMSSGEYVELIINKQYCGLYLLQRRIDQKYLQLDYTQDILFKGVNTWEANTIEEGYEIVYSPYSKGQTYQILSETLSLDGQGKIDVNQFIEVQLFLDYLSASDNSGYKNAFYLLQKESDNFKMTILPWDTDMSMGLTWIDSMVYDDAVSLSKHVHRREYGILAKLHPQLDAKLSIYWKQARKQIYTEEIIHSLISENVSVICSSGAYQRDVQLWGSQHNGLDTHETLLEWSSERLSILDGRYAYIQ